MQQSREPVEIEQAEAGGVRFLRGDVLQPAAHATGRDRRLAFEVDVEGDAMADESPKPVGHAPEVEGPLGIVAKD